MALINPLSPDQLSNQCDPDQFSFETTAELEPLDAAIGQKRAIDAVQFGVGIRQPGYNLFALGPNGTGKHTSVGRLLEQKSAEEAVPPDWCYVYDFDHPQKPNALQLPSGQAPTLQNDMKALVEELFVVIPAAFEGDEYHTQKGAIESEFQERQEAELQEIRKEAEKEDIALIRTPSGLAFAPIQNGEVIKPEEFMKLDEETRQTIEKKIGELQEKLQKVIRQVPQWVREGRSRVKALNEEVSDYVVKPLLDELKEKYSELLEVVDYLSAVQRDIISHNEIFLDGADGGMPQPDGNPAVMAARMEREAFAKRYEVNVIVDHSETEGAPVIYEPNPNYPNLVGRIEHVVQMGALLTDFSLIQPGALHRANGGYLLLDARKLLLQPYAWEGLKRALRSEEIIIEAPAQSMGLASTVALEPEPIPLNLKVVLIGERMLYYLMVQHDPDFKELFKVAADFEDEVDRNEEANQEYARLIATLARQEDLLPFDRSAVARVIERGARLVGDSEKLTAHLGSIADLLREASYWAGQAGGEIVSAEHIQQATDAQVYRSSRIKEKMQEQILRETILIDTEGEKVGQINALAVLSLGNYMFGRPNRISARVRMGKGEVIDIERQVDLGGPLHSKGVMILASYLGSNYAVERPLALSASLVFEQSYGGVDGDSASSAELYALLSALAEVPIKQSLAVTGSVNQHGDVQAIGGVNEKIEGFFDVCHARGLTGEQGVLIPESNVKHLMLREDVVQAVKDGRFHIYAVESIAGGIELLTGVPAGEMDEEGNYPEGSIGRRIVERIEKIAKKQREYSRPPKGEKDEEKEVD
jgi:lon-related putative ATP-dependent protease